LQRESILTPFGCLKWDSPPWKAPKRAPWINFTFEDNYRNRIDFQINEQGCGITYFLGSTFNEKQKDLYMQKIIVFESINDKKQKDTSSSL